MNPFYLLAQTCNWLGDFTVLLIELSKFYWRRWLYLQSEHVPINMAFLPMLEAQARIMLLAPELGLMKPYLHLARAIAELKNTWRKV